VREQPPLWFLSHWWGETVADFLRCVELHAATRSLAADTTYWVCAYANRQHSLDDDLTDDPKQSSFYRAMEIANFKVLLILNAKSALAEPAMPFTRIWCAFEETMCLHRASSPLDVATFQGGVASLLTQDLTEVEQAMEEQDPGRGSSAKSAREEPFPLEIIECGLSFDLLEADASVAEDKTHILNSIANRPLNLEVPKDHVKFDEASRRLRSLFAIAFLRRTLAPAVDQERRDKQRSLQALLAEEIRGDDWRRSLDMGLAGCSVSDGALETLVTHLPQNLKELSLDFSCTEADDASLKAIGKAIPSSVESTYIDVSHCERISEVGVAAFKRALSGKVKLLCLKLEGTNVSEATVVSCRTLDGLRRWEPKRQRHYCGQDRRTLLDRKARINRDLRKLKKWLRFYQADVPFFQGNADPGAEKNWLRKARPGERNAYISHPLIVKRLFLSMAEELVLQELWNQEDRENVGLFDAAGMDDAGIAEELYRAIHEVMFQSKDWASVQERLRVAPEWLRNCIPPCETALESFQAEIKKLQRDEKEIDFNMQTLAEQRGDPFEDEYDGEFESEDRMDSEQSDVYFDEEKGELDEEEGELDEM